MNIPNLPTDNLYKFIALSGLVIIILGYITFNNQTNKLTNEGIQIRNEFEVHFLESEIFIDEMKEVISKDSILVQKWNSLHEKDRVLSENMENPLYVGSDSVLVLDAESIQIDKISNAIVYKDDTISHDNITKKNNEIKMTRLLLRQKYKQYQKNIQRIDQLEKNFNWSYAAGLILIFFGFCFWYFKLQVYQDIIIKETAEEKNKDIVKNIKLIYNVFIRFSYGFVLSVAIGIILDIKVKIVCYILLCIIYGVDGYFYLKKAKVNIQNEI